MDRSDRDQRSKAFALADRSPNPLYRLEGRTVLDRRIVLRYAFGSDRGAPCFPRKRFPLGCVRVSEIRDVRRPNPRALPRERAWPIAEQIGAAVLAPKVPEQIGPAPVLIDVVKVGKENRLRGDTEGRQQIRDRLAARVELSLEKASDHHCRARRSPDLHQGILSPSRHRPMVFTSTRFGSRRPPEYHVRVPKRPHA